MRIKENDELMTDSNGYSSFSEHLPLNGAHQGGLPAYTLDYTTEPQGLHEKYGQRFANSSHCTKEREKYPGYGCCHLADDIIWSHVIVFLHTHLAARS